MEAPNTASLAQAFAGAGKTRQDLLRVFRTFNANAPAFRAESSASRGRGAMTADPGGGGGPRTIQVD